MTCSAPAATIGDHAILGAAHRLAWSMGRIDATDGVRVASALVRRGERHRRAGDALRRLASDPSATPAERALAAVRADEFASRVA